MNNSKFPKLNADVQRTSSDASTWCGDQGGSVILACIPFPN